MFKIKRRIQLVDISKCIKIKNMGEFDLRIQYEMIKCFMDNSDGILFHRYNTKLSEIETGILENLKNDTFDDFCEDIIYFEHDNKEKLVTDIKEIIKKCKTKYNCLDTVEDLYCKLLKQDIEIMKWQEIDQVKLMIFTLITFSNHNEGERRWIEDRIIFENKMFIDDEGIKNGTSSSIWYMPKNTREIIQSMKDEVDYKCIILNKDVDISKYSYALSYQETEDNYDLLIFDRCNSFAKQVLPILERYDKNIIKLLKYE